MCHGCPMLQQKWKQQEYNTIQWRNKIVVYFIVTLFPYTTQYLRYTWSAVYAFRGVCVLRRLMDVSYTSANFLFAVSLPRVFVLQFAHMRHVIKWITTERKFGFYRYSSQVYLIKRFNGVCQLWAMYSMLCGVISQLVFVLYKEIKKNSVALVRKRNYTDRATAAVDEVVPTFVVRGRYVASATDSHGR
jgi:hypothetical protein